MKQKSIVVFFSLFILAVNIVLVYPYFRQSAPGWVESIEVSFITIGRWWAQNFPHVFWNPYWYAGFPMRFSYVPLVPISTAVLGKLIGDFGRAYHLIVGMAYVLVPISLFFLIRCFTKNSLTAFLGALMFSLLPPLDNIFLHAKEAQALFPSWQLPPWRLMILIIWGEGPHTMAMVFLPLAGLFYLKTLEKGRYQDLILTSFWIALVALSNLIGLWALAMLMGSIFLIYFFWQKNRQATLFHSVLVIVFAYLFSAFWLTPNYLKNELFSESGQLFSTIFNYFPWGLLGAVLAFSLLIYGLRQLVKSHRMAMVILWFILNWLVVILFYKYDFSLAPQARRYIPEFQMAMATLVALGTTKLVSYLVERIKVKKAGLLVKVIFPLLLILLLLAGTIKIWGAARYFASLNNHAKTGYKEKFMNEYLSQRVSQTERIFASANNGFWLNFDTDLWQLRGGHWQASVHPWQPHAEYQIINGEDGETSRLWLKTFAIRWLVVNTQGSDIHYQDYGYPEKFGEFLGEGEEVAYPTEIVYQVPLKQGMVAAVPLAERNDLSEPQNGADKLALNNYVNWLESSDSLLEFERINNDRYLIKGDLFEGEEIRVAMSYDKGFRAEDSQGKTLRIEKDPLGFLLIRPETGGRQEITLTYGPTFDFLFGGLFWLLGILLAILLRKKFVDGKS